MAGWKVSKVKNKWVCFCLVSRPPYFGLVIRFGSRGLGRKVCSPGRSSGQSIDREGLRESRTGTRQGLFTQHFHLIGLLVVYTPFVKNLTREGASSSDTRQRKMYEYYKIVDLFRTINYFMLVAFSSPVKFSKSVFRV